MTSVHMASIRDRFFLLLVPLWSRGFSSVGTGGWTESEVVVEEEIIKAVFEVGRPTRGWTYEKCTSSRLKLLPLSVIKNKTLFSKTHRIVQMTTYWHLQALQSEPRLSIISPPRLFSRKDRSCLRVRPHVSSAYKNPISGRFSWPNLIRYRGWDPQNDNEGKWPCLHPNLKVHCCCVVQGRALNGTWMAQVTKKISWDDVILSTTEVGVLELQVWALQMLTCCASDVCELASLYFQWQFKASLAL